MMVMMRAGCRWRGEDDEATRGSPLLLQPVGWGGGGGGGGWGCDRYKEKYQAMYNHKETEI